jgi:hypothetical protein
VQVTRGRRSDWIGLEGEERWEIGRAHVPIVPPTIVDSKLKLKQLSYTRIQLSSALVPTSSLRPTPVPWTRERVKGLLRDASNSNQPAHTHSQSHSSRTPLSSRTTGPLRPSKGPRHDRVQSQEQGPRGRRSVRTWDGESPGNRSEVVTLTFPSQPKSRHLLLLPRPLSISVLAMTLYLHAASTGSNLNLSPSSQLICRATASESRRTMSRIL